MKCPNCGCEMAEDHLYCEECGMEIRIVPDFEPEIENSITETLSTVAEEIEGKAKENQAAYKDRGKEKNEQAESGGIGKDLKTAEETNKNWLLISLLTFIGVILIATFTAMFIYNKYSVSHQVENAKKYADMKDYDHAIAYLNKAIELDQGNSELTFMLANYYYLQGNKQQSAELLMSMINSGTLEPEDNEKAYEKVISIYDEQDLYQEINDLLLNCGDSSVQASFQNYMALPPEFSYIGGSYDEVIPLKLTANTTGKIYYTMDGSEPDVVSQVYTAPLFLESGHYEITAIFINEFGIRSQVVKNSYIITLTVPEPPEVLLYSGEFTEPTMVEVIVPEVGKVYYTTDGTDPNTDSQKYVQPIPMPLGRTNFKFVTISDDGVPSEIISRAYEFNLKTDITVETAVLNVMQALISRNVLTDMEGHSQGVNGKYVYKFDSLVEIKDKGYYYVLNEYYEDINGSQNKSEHLYAVEVYTGSPNRLVYDENGQMDLISLN